MWPTFHNSLDASKFWTQTGLVGQIFFLCFLLLLFIEVNAVKRNVYGVLSPAMDNSSKKDALTQIWFQSAIKHQTNSHSTFLPGALQYTICLWEESYVCLFRS